MTNKQIDKMAIIFTAIGWGTQMLLLVMMTMVYPMTNNWAWLVLAFSFQLYGMPFVWLICGVGGIISSVSAIKRIGKKPRYILTLALSAIMVILMLAFAPRFLSFWF